MALPLENLEQLRDVLTILDDINPLVAMMAEFEARSGLRYVDISKLTFKDIMVNGVPRKSFTIIQSKSYNSRMRADRIAGMSDAQLKRHQRQAKEKSKVTVYVNDSFAELINRLYLTNGHNSLVFASNHHHASGKAISISYVNQALSQAAKELQLPMELSTHSLRKTFAMTLHEEKGAPLTVVKNLLGHSSLSATEHYLSASLTKTKDFATSVDF